MILKEKYFFEPLCKKGTQVVCWWELSLLSLFVFSKINTFLLWRRKKRLEALSLKDSDPLGSITSKALTVLESWKQCIPSLSSQFQSWNCSKIRCELSFRFCVFTAWYSILFFLCNNFKLFLWIQWVFFHCGLLKSRSRSKDRWSNLCFPIHLQWQFL